MNLCTRRSRNGNSFLTELFVGRAFLALDDHCTALELDAPHHAIAFGHRAGCRFAPCARAVAIWFSLHRGAQPNARWCNRAARHQDLRYARLGTLPGLRPVCWTLSLLR